MFASDRELIHKYMAVSSAKSLTLDLPFSGRSFMYAKKRIGPRTEPCGTPEERDRAGVGTISNNWLFSIV